MAEYILCVHCSICQQSTTAENARPPRRGDVWICTCCGVLSMFAFTPSAGLHLAFLSDAEYQALNPTVRAELAEMQKALARLRGGTA
jgi:hypothetical protein